MDLSGTYLADSWQGQLLVEAADINRPCAISVRRPNHCVKAVLDPGKHLGLALQDGYDLGICLLDHPDSTGQQLGPVSEGSSVVRRP